MHKQYVSLYLACGIIRVANAEDDMSKISEYLNEHILGEVTHADSIRDKFSRDGSVLSITPEIVMFPRSTNDIRKVARFAWQLSEKGHKLGLTPRGFGGDATGASVGEGVIINTTAHLNQVINLSLKDKQKLVHVQPGIACSTLNQILSYQGVNIPIFPESASYSTVGGVIANGSRGPLSGRYGGIRNWIDRLEVVLANGDVIETRRLSKKELSKKIGEQTFEAEIYRKLDALIEDNEAHIQSELIDYPYGNAGYSGIADVKLKDGSFDLTPLFVGSQGTLGIISEAILRADFTHPKVSKMIIAAETIDDSRDIAEEIKKVAPSRLDIIDGRLYAQAKKQGKQYPFFNGPNDDFAVGAVLYVEFNDEKEHLQKKKLKSVAKLLANYRSHAYDTQATDEAEIDAMRSVMSSLFMTEDNDESMPPLFDGVRVPDIRQEEFLSELKKLEQKHHCELFVRTSVLDETYFVRTMLHLGKVVDKQKMFKLIGDFAAVVEACRGVFVYDSAEGRLKANAVNALLDDTTLALFEAIRGIFDPNSTLNPGVKQQVTLRELVNMLRDSYDVSDRAYMAPSS